MSEDRARPRERTRRAWTALWLGVTAIIVTAGEPVAMPEHAHVVVSAPTAGLRDSAAANTLAARLAAAGRGEVTFVREAEDPFGGKPLLHGGTLALEAPDRVLLHFTTTGERLALRADGGQWLQPELEQMLVLGPEQLVIARLWWGVLLGTGAAEIETVRLGTRRYRLITRIEGQAVDSASVWLDREGLPARLDFRDDNGSEVHYRFKTWRFSKARGQKAFVLTAPEGFETVRLP